MSRPDSQGSADAAESVATDYIEAPTGHPLSEFSRRLWAVLWPAFLMAGVTEMLVFAMVDPQDLHGLGGVPLEWPRSAVYTGAFFMFWAVISLAGGLTQLLLREPRSLNNLRR